MNEQLAFSEIRKTNYYSNISSLKVYVALHNPLTTPYIHIFLQSVQCHYPFATTATRLTLPSLPWTHQSFSSLDPTLFPLAHFFLPS